MYTLSGHVELFCFVLLPLGLVVVSVILVFCSLRVFLSMCLFVLCALC